MTAVMMTRGTLWLTIETAGKRNAGVYMAVTILLKNHEPVQLSLSHREHHRLVPDSCDHHHLDAPHLDHNRRFVECPDHDLADRPGHQREPTTRITTTALTAKKNDDNRVNRPRNQRKTLTRTTCTALTAERYPPAKKKDGRATHAHRVFAHHCHNDR